VFLVVLLFAILIQRAFAIGKQAVTLERTYAALVAQGIGIWIGVQSFINMGVNMGLLPTKGLTLPLMSFGGSGILANCVALAILLRIDWENGRSCAGATPDADPDGHGRRYRRPHLPGLAVADALRERGWKVVWMGNPDGMEARIVPASGYEVAWVRFTACAARACCASCCCPSTCCGLCPGAGADPPRQARRGARHGRLRHFPGGMMAALLGRPVVVHEQNSVAGLANRVLAGVADKVVTGFPDVLKKGEWLGNPVRADITAVAPPAARFAGRSGR
jgi:hypothetical protein